MSTDPFYLATGFILFLNSRLCSLIKFVLTGCEAMGLSSASHMLPHLRVLALQCHTEVFTYQHEKSWKRARSVQWGADLAPCLIVVRLRVYSVYSPAAWDSSLEWAARSKVDVWIMKPR